MSNVESGRFGCLPWVAAWFSGGAVAHAAWQLTAWARWYCDAGYEAGGRLELNVLLPLTALAGGCAGLAALALGRAVAQPAPKAVRVLLPPVSVLVVTVLLGWWFFATVGTLDDYPGDSGRCPTTNIPPRWPAWIPA
ncbi:hypothetical protein ABZ896_06735 [Streptomyces sp. NPDC047072]|uniref:hypothetical protein n=1 Tax=Streptomyces sp. NPDC047072 TaxID=3154809 RepID=UPI0033CDC77B